MSRRNTFSREFFSTIAVVLVLGLSVMCAIQTALSAAYFVQERCTALNDILNQIRIPLWLVSRPGMCCRTSERS